MSIHEDNTSRLFAVFCAIALLRVVPFAQAQPSPSGSVDSAQVSPDNLRKGGDAAQGADQVKRFDKVNREWRDRVRQVLHIATADVQRIDCSALEEISLRLNGQERSLKLHPYSMRSSDFRLMVQDDTGALIEAEPPPAVTYRGSLVQDAAARVAATVHDGRLHALVFAGDGQLWSIEPVRETIPVAPADLHVVYRASDVVGEEWSCGFGAGQGSQDLPPAKPYELSKGVQRNPLLVDGSLGRTEIAFDADVEFFELNGSSVANTIRDIEMVMNQVGLIYQDQVDICYAMTGIIVRTTEPDPYTSTDTGTLLCELTDYWNANVTIQRDVAHLMTGKDLEGSAFIGAAWPAAICNDDITACGGGSAAYGLSQSRITTYLLSRTKITAHELGHNWGACHCDDPDCTGGGQDTDCAIMRSTPSPFDPLAFGSRAVTAITDHRNNYSNCLDNCLDPVYVDWSSPPGGDGSITNPFQTVTEGVRYALVGGTVIISTGSYPENLTINKPVTLNATGGTATVGD